MHIPHVLDTCLVSPRLRWQHDALYLVLASVRILGVYHHSYTPSFFGPSVMRVRVDGLRVATDEGWDLTFAADHRIYIPHLHSTSRETWLHNINTHTLVIPHDSIQDATR